MPSNLWQTIILFLILAASLLGTVQAYSQVLKHRNPFGLARRYSPLGIFVWGDGLVFGPFWLGLTSWCLWFTDWYLWGLSFSVFGQYEG